MPAKLYITFVWSADAKEKLTASNIYDELKILIGRVSELKLRNIFIVHLLFHKQSVSERLD